MSVGFSGPVTLREQYMPGRGVESERLYGWWQSAHADTAHLHDNPPPVCPTRHIYGGLRAFEPITIKITNHKFTLLREWKWLGAVL